MGKGKCLNRYSPLDKPKQIRTHVIDRVTSENLRRVINECVDKDSVLMTDQLQAYKSFAPEYKGHETVNHGVGEYARGDVHCNSAESFFGLFKRGVNGSFHHVSRQHLFRYADEFAFRWTFKNVSDEERTNAALLQAPSKRIVMQRR